MLDTPELKKVGDIYAVVIRATRQITEDNKRDWLIDQQSEERQSQSYLIYKVLCLYNCFKWNRNIRARSQSIYKNM